MAENRNDIKINKLAQELGVKSRVLIDILTEYGYSGKTNNSSVSEEEYNVIMSTMTLSNQIVDINGYFSGKTYITVVTEERLKKREEEARLAAEKAEAERLAIEKADAERLAAEKAAKEKAESELLAK